MQAFYQGLIVISVFFENIARQIAFLYECVILRLFQADDAATLHIVPTKSYKAEMKGPSDRFLCFSMSSFRHGSITI